MAHLGKILILIGVLIIIVGLALLLAGNRLGWLGRLPGDIRIERDNFRFYFPITTMIILSIVLSLILYIIKRIING
jgi:hypothetical protein